jgi:prepilin-type N-terminal cleavage/methylation domain-containing protein
MLPLENTDMNRTRGFTLIELLVVMAIIALLVGLLLPALAKARAQAKSLADSSRIRGVHQSWITFSREFEGIFPTPGLIDRKPVNGIDYPGRGVEDKVANTTANLHSVCIMNNYYTPELCVGTTEPSGKVFVKDNYNYEFYDAIADNYWDSTFRAHLNEESNVSYASMPIVGEKQLKQWKDTVDSNWAVLGNRGVANGSYDTNQYNKSVTLLIHGGKKEWDGHVCFQDNHVSYLKTFTPEGLNYRKSNGDIDLDNIFTNQNYGDSDDGSTLTGYDCYLAIVNEFFGPQDNPVAIECIWD